MKVGDLVTLSSRGKNLEVGRMWERHRVSLRMKGNGDKADSRLIGLLLRIEQPTHKYQKHPKYIISWLTDGPKSREAHAWHRDTGYWYRHDLKFVAKA